MSRLRKGKKYKGGNFACQFKSAVTMKSPLYETAEVAIAGKAPEEEMPESTTVSASEELKNSGASAATINNLGPDDVVPKKTRQTVSERQAWMDKNKQKAEDRAEEAARIKAEEAAAEEAAETKRYRDADGNLVYEDDYDKGMTGKERRAESKQNKQEIRKEFREDKADIKARRKSGELTRKEAKALKKENRGEKKGLKLSLIHI